jgi:pyruvate/2-oxoglutarate/acetoin dehydrogenase E1 component
VPKDKLVELPVFEDTQLGLCIGLSLAGYLPISVFPRINFLLLALNQLVLHLDCIPRYSKFRPKVLVRTAVATPEPLNPGPQHLGDFTESIRGMLKTVKVVKLETASQIVPAYEEAVAGEGSTLLIEEIARYGDAV